MMKPTCFGLGFLCLACIAVGLGPLGLSAQEPASGPAPLRIHLMDGSVLTGQLTLVDLEVETDYGKLVVPVTAIRSFTPGLGSHPEIGARFELLVRNLASENFPTRESAQKELLKFGPQIRPSLELKLKDEKDLEARKRITSLLEDLSAESEGEESETAHAGWIERDTVETTHFTIVGKIVPQALTIASKYGELKVTLKDIRKGQTTIIDREDLRKTVGVDGLHIVWTSFFDSGIRLQRGDEIKVNADGNVTMTPWGPQAISTPDGSQNYGWYIPNQIAAGALVGRIGTNGRIFKVGSKAEFVADRPGNLFFAIALPPGHEGQVFPGRYNARVVVHPKID